MFCALGLAWHRTFCCSTKQTARNTLIELGSTNIGRIPLTKFYNSHDYFGETDKYLRDFGILDVATPSREANMYCSPSEGKRVQFLAWLPFGSARLLLHCGTLGVHSCAVRGCRFYACSGFDVRRWTGPPRHVRFRLPTRHGRRFTQLLHHVFSRVFSRTKRVLC